MSSDAREAGDLNRGPVVLRLTTFGIPLVLGMFFHSLFNLVDLIIVGKLGPYALAAVNQASLIGFIPQLFSTGIQNASIALISRNFGMRNYKRANANAMQGFLLQAIVAAALGIPSFIWASELNQLVGSAGEALPAANDYLRISSAGLITLFALMQVTAVLRAGGDSFWPMFLLIGANVLNVFLDFALVRGLWGFPKLGVAGAAWGTVIARGIFAVFGLWLVTRPSSPVRIIWARTKVRARMLWNLTALGIPSSLQFVVRVVGYGAIMNLVTRFGDGEAMHAGLAVGFRLDLLAIFTGVGWGSGAAAMVGQALGAGDPERAERAGWAATVLDIITMGAIGLIFYHFAPELMVFFGEDPKVDPRFALANDLGVEYLRISVFAYGFAAVGVSLAQALNGAGSTRMPLVLDTIGFLAIQIPIAAFVCLRHTTYGYTRPVLWWSLVATTGASAAFYALVWHWGRWKDKKIQ